MCHPFLARPARTYIGTLPTSRWVTREDPTASTICAISSPPASWHPASTCRRPRVGWATLAFTTLDIYAAFAPDADRHAADVIGRLVTGAVAA